MPWLSASPITGTLAADTGLQVVDVTMDAAQVNQPGVYYAGLKAKTDDPVNPFRTIAVTMTVPVNPGMGKLNGIVYTQGACDITPAPLADASVNLTDGVFNWTLSTDASGYYQFWVETTAPLTVTASAADHLPDQAVVSVPASVTVTHDLHLRWLKPCIDATPDSLSATMMYGLIGHQSPQPDQQRPGDRQLHDHPAHPGLHPHDAPDLAAAAPSDQHQRKIASLPADEDQGLPDRSAPATPSATLINDGSFEGTAWTDLSLHPAACHGSVTGPASWVFALHSLRHSVAGILGGGLRHSRTALLSP